MENIRQNEAAMEAYAITAPDAKILITDDNEFNLKVASGLLSFMEIEAKTADSGFKAIELIEQNDYDIVFMDHMMPEMDGVETVHRIRKLGEKYEKLIIIALTANAVLGSREMFLENGFNDFISKPIDAEELQKIVQKYLPPDKIQKEAAKDENRQAVADKEEQLHRKAIITFVKENRNTFGNITGALDSGDTKTAHRIAHTLKSAAGYLGKKDLQEAAFSLEQSLGADPPKAKPQQLGDLKEGLEKALREFEPIAEEAEREKPAAVQIGAEELESLLAELRPLLEKGDFGAADYVEKLQGVAGMEELVELIDDFDFEGALQALNG